jgi:hypothetical protein
MGWARPLIVSYTYVCECVIDLLALEYNAFGVTKG